MKNKQINKPDFYDEKNIIIDNARSFMKKMHDKIQSSSKDVFDKAYDRGYEKGQDDGFTQGHENGIAKAEEEAIKKVKDSVENLQNCAADILRQKNDLILSTEEEIFQLAYDIAKTILSYEINNNDEAILSIFKSGIRELVDKKIITVRVNKENESIINIHKTKLKDELNTNIIKVICDTQLSSGQCLIETDNERIDASINTQLDQIIQMRKLKTKK